MIRKAEIQDLPILAVLACRLWPEHKPEEMRAEFAETIEKQDTAFFCTPAQIFVPPVKKCTPSIADDPWGGR